MADQKQIDVLLKAILDAKGFEELQGQLKKTSETAKQSKEGAVDFKGALTELATEFGLVMGAAEIVRKEFEFLKEAFDEAVKGEAEFFRLGASLKFLAGASDDVVDSAKEFIDELERADAIGKDKLIPTLTRLAASTKSVSDAQFLVKVAADAAAAGIGTFEENASALERLAANGTIASRDMSELAVYLRKNHEAGEDYSVTLAKIAPQLADMSQKNDTTEQQLKRTNIEWGNAKEAIGNLFQKLSLEFLPVLKYVAEAFVVVVGFVRSAITVFEILAKGIATNIEVMYKLATMDFSGAKRAIVDYYNTSRKAAEESFNAQLKGIKDVWDAFTIGPPGAQKPPAQIGKPPEGEGGGKPGGKPPGKKSALLTAFEADTKGLVKSAKERERMYEELARISDRSAKEQERGQREMAQTQKQIDAELAASAHKLAQEKRSAQQAGLDAAYTAFGKNKGIASGLALVNTWQAAAEGLAAPPGPPWSLAYVALALAEGFKTIQGINSADASKSGFDDPQNDLAAMVGGRKWAADMINNFSKGASHGWASGMLAAGNSSVNNQTTYNNQKTTHINVTGLGIMSDDDAMMRKFTRKLQTYSNQLEPERTQK